MVLFDQLPNFTVDRNTGVVKEDDNHMTFASGKLTIHIYLNQQGNVVGECVVRKAKGRTIFEPNLSIGEFPPPSSK